MSAEWIDKNVLEGCIKNDRKAQELFYKQFYGPMISLCMRYTRNEEDALEVLHNGFLKVFKHLGTYDAAKASLYTWIKTIMVNSAIDFIRARQKFKPRRRQLSEPPTPKVATNIRPRAVDQCRMKGLPWGRTTTHLGRVRLVSEGSKGGLKLEGGSCEFLDAYLFADALIQAPHF